MSITHAADQNPCGAYCDHPGIPHNEPETRTVEERLAAIEETQQKILELIQTANIVIETVVKEVKPTMEMLMNHPMLKMLGVGGKKK